MYEFPQESAASIKGSCGGFHVLSLRDVSSKPREYRRRKMHSKTKDGCLTCKAKRVKCDESRPICIRCRRNSRACNYPQGTAMYSGYTPSSLNSMSWNLQKVSKMSAVTIIPFPCPSISNGTPSIHLMQHLERHWSDIFCIPRSKDIAPLFQANSLVRNTILALTACHLRHVSATVVEHRIAECYQQSLALQDYQKYLDTPRTILRQPGVNSMLLSAVLLNILAFVLPPSDCPGEHDDPSTSWIFNPNEGSLSWLAMQAGIRPLMLSMAGYLSNANAFLGLMLVGDDQWTMRMSVSSYRVDIIPKVWLKAFELDADDCSSLSYNFRTLLLVLAQLRCIPPSQVNIFRNLQFPGRLYAEFRSLLYDRDERVLWLLGYWLGLMRRCEKMWWYEQRVNRDYEAIRIWLYSLNLLQRPDTKGKVWREMMEDYELAPVWP